jgi:hypothetical protein
VSRLCVASAKLALHNKSASRMFSQPPTTYTMARTFRGVTLRPSTDKPRPKPTSPLHHSFFFADLGQVIAERLDADSIILIPIDFNLYESNFTGFERWQETCGPARCWKTTRCYEQIGETHARIVEYVWPKI